MSSIGQPYRKSGSREPSPVLDKMQAGQAAGAGNALLKRAAKGARPKGLRVPRIPPPHKRAPK